MTLRPGDRVTVLWGIDDERLPARVVQPPHGPVIDVQGRVAVRLDGCTDPAGYSLVKVERVVPAHMAVTAAVARASDPWTSHAAAASQTPARLSETKRRILHALVMAGDRGLNDFELEAQTGGAQTSWGVRRGEMTNQAGLLRWNGEVRSSDTGSPSKVHVVTELGLEVWRDLHKGAAA